MNYLGLIGVLGLQGEGPGRVPVQSSGQIADLGGGALMAAFGILTALRHRDATGQGQVVDVSMADGALSWMAFLAARALAGEQPPARGRDILSGGVVCYRPYECADGWVTLGALEPKFWRNWCEGAGRPDLIERQFEPPESDAHAEVRAVFMERTREQWQAFASEHDCCLEPVLDLDEALESELVRAREMVVEIEQPVKMSATPGDPHRLPGPTLGEHTSAVLAEAGFAAGEIAELEESGAVGGPPAGTGEARGSFLA
jgi:crotonobetainyl-CoA:carnitine CoA-transferase CaiB-like acyl-CoA transferase